MSKKRLETLMVRALDEAAVTLGELARESGYHAVSFARYKTGDRRPTPEAALALAGVLRKRSARLAELADRLENAARAQQEG